MGGESQVDLESDILQGMSDDVISDYLTIKKSGSIQKILNGTDQRALTNKISIGGKAFELTGDCPGLDFDDMTVNTSLSDKISSLPPISCEALEKYIQIDNLSEPADPKPEETSNKQRKDTINAMTSQFERMKSFYAYRYFAAVGLIFIAGLYFIYRYLKNLPKTISNTVSKVSNTIPFLGSNKPVDSETKEESVKQQEEPTPNEESPQPTEEPAPQPTEEPPAPVN